MTGAQEAAEAAEAAPAMRHSSSGSTMHGRDDAHRDTRPHTHAHAHAPDGDASSSSDFDTARGGTPSRTPAVDKSPSPEESPEKSLESPAGGTPDELPSPSTADEVVVVAAAAAAAADQPAPEHPEASRTKVETFLVIFALCLALFLGALDMTIVTTAIPTISDHFHSSGGYVWIGSAYQLANAAFVPAWGKLSDIFGRKPALIMAVAVFWVGSLLCALSNSMGMLIAARAIQGIGGGGAIVLPNICISDLFSMRKRGMYFGILGVVWAVAGAIGPVLGGVFSSKVSWRWCFYINLPTSGLAMAIIVFVLKLHNPRTPVRRGLTAIDWAGNVLVIAGTLLLLFGLEFGGVTFPWKSATVICLLVFGVVTLALFGLWENLVARYPVMPSRLFKSRSNVAAYTCAVVQALVFISGSYWLPLYFQAVLGASSLLSGVYFLPYAVSLSVMSAISGMLIKKTGLYKPLIIFGFIVMTLGFGLFIDLGAEANWAKIVLFQVVAGIGVGPNFQGPLLPIQASIQPGDNGAATSTFQFLRQVSTAVSVVIGGGIFNNIMQGQQPKLVAALGPELAARFSGSNAASSVFLVKTLEAPARQVVRQAYWTSLQRMYIAYTAISFFGLFVTFFVEQKQLKTEHQEHKTGLQSLKAERHRKTDAEKTVAADTAQGES